MRTRAPGVGFHSGESVAIVRPAANLPGMWRESECVVVRAGAKRGKPTPAKAQPEVPALVRKSLKKECRPPSIKPPFRGS